jgi:hypothetical protein
MFFCLVVLKINLFKIPVKSVTLKASGDFGHQTTSESGICDPENPLECRLCYELHAILFCSLYAAASVFGGQ